MLLGSDQYGVPLEVVAIEPIEGEFVVIHAMAMRAKYSGEYVEVMRWREHW